MQAEQFCAKENNLNENNPEVNEEKMDILGTIDEDYSEAKRSWGWNWRKNYQRFVMSLWIMGHTITTEVEMRK